MHALLPQVVKLNARFGLFQPNQSILLGLSGGVDSMVLLALLSDLRHCLTFPLRLTAAYIALPPVALPTEERTAIAASCARYGVPFTVIDGSIPEAPTLDCYSCARQRRRLLCEHALSNHCDTIALGHNQDDYLETGLLNLIYHGHLETLPPRQSLLDGQVTIIRPLLNIPKKHILAYARQTQLTYSSTTCPYGQHNRRTQVRALLRQLSKLNRRVRANLLNAIDQWPTTGTMA